MSRLSEFIKSLKKESLKTAILRTLKITSYYSYRFIVNIPIGFMRILKRKVKRKVNNYYMYLYLSDKGISRELYTYHERESFGTKLLCDELVKRDDVVLDIGANIGYFALLESTIVGPSGKVYAVEPSPVNYQRLNENTKLNKCDNIETFNLALGNRIGTAEMYISNYSNWSRLVEKTGFDKICDVVTVPITTIDRFLKNKKKPSLIRMDVEGYEINIFRGMNETLKTCNSGIFLEFHPSVISKDDKADFFHILKKNKYQLKYCFYNPVPYQNIFSAYAFKHLGEYDCYKGKFLNISFDEAEHLIVSEKINKMIQFFFYKGR